MKDVFMILGGSIGQVQAIQTVKKYNIAGVLTISSDIAVPTACYVNESLGLSNQGIGISKAVTDKSFMREAFELGKVASPQFIKLESDKAISEIVPQIEESLS